MPLTPEEVGNKSFSTVFGKGYKKEEVDEFLALVAKDYSASIQKIAVAAEGGLSSEDDFAVEVAVILQVAREAAERMKDKAKTEADVIVESARSKARRLRDDAEKFKTEAVDDAKRQAEELLKEAEERYGALLEREDKVRERVVGLEELVSEMRRMMEPAEEIDLTRAEPEITLTEGVAHPNASPPDDRDPENIWELEERLRTTGQSETNSKRE